MSRDKIEPVLFGFVLSGLMSLVVSGISTVRVVGLEDRFIGLWAGAWVTAWAVAFPVVLVAAPMARKVVQRLTARF
jgi:hypothetical protein